MCWRRRAPSPGWWSGPFSERLTAGRPSNLPAGLPDHANGGDSPAWSRKRQPFETGIERRTGTVPYAELHCHSNFSFLDGASHPEELAEEAARLGLEALALTDHGNLYGAIEFYNQAKAKEIKPLVGCELYLAAGSRLERTGRSDEGKSIYHLGLLCRDLTGYQNLLKMVSDAHLKGFYYKPRTDLETLAKYSKGLIGFTGCLASLVPQHLLEKGPPASIRP